MKRLLVLSLVFVAACSKKPEAPLAAADAPVEHSGDVTVVRVAHGEQFPLADVTTRALADELNATGTVTPDVSLTVPVNALAGGRVTEVKVRLGDRVEKGQHLLSINSPDLSMAFGDYQKFEADEVLSKRSLDRAKLLFDHGAGPQKDVQTAEDAEQKALVDVHTAEEHIRILGGDPARISSIFDVRAPISGFITEQNVTGAAGVKSPDNAPNLFTISDLSRVWILCDVYENDLARVKLGDIAKVKLNAYADRTFNARVSNVSTVLDPATRTAKVRLVVENSAGLFRPGMFAAVTFHSPTTRQHLVIPTTAILRLHDRDWVYVPSGKSDFRRIEIQTGQSLPGGLQEVLGGVADHDKVVTNALQLSNSEDQS